MYFRSMFVAGLVLIFAFSGTSATAGDQPGNSYGVRAGLGINPDQFVFGAQSVMGRVMKVARFAPSADIGVGNDVTVLTFNPDIRLLFSPPRSNSTFYGQVGPTIAVFDPKEGKGDTEIGLTLSVGLKLPMGNSGFYNLEGRFGIGDVPDARILFGILFGGGKGDGK